MRYAEVLDQAIPIIAVLAGLCWAVFGFTVLFMFWRRDTAAKS